MSYVIHGATGAQGAPVAAALVAAGKPVVALTRRPDAVVEGARVQAVDASSVAGLTEAYRGAEGVFVHLPIGTEQDRESYARNIVAALREARPARVVFSTSGGVVVPGSTPGETTSGAASTVVNGLADSGLNHAVIAPRLFLENLLLPPVVEAARERGSLPYPLRADFPVSWASHLDIADAATVLFERPEVTGVIDIGQDPALTGPDLAEAFSTHLGHDIAYEALTPAAFGELITPMFGADATAGVMALYEHLNTLPDNAIAPELSAQKLLGHTPRTTGQWLADIGL